MSLAEDSYQLFVIFIGGDSTNLEYQQNAYKMVDLTKIVHITTSQILKFHVSHNIYTKNRKAVLQWCSVYKMFLKISQNS